MHRNVVVCLVSVLAFCGRPASEVERAEGVRTAPPVAADAAAPSLPATQAPGSPSTSSQSASPAPSPSGPWTLEPIEVEKTITGSATLVAARVASHPGFDRLVLEFGPGGLPSYGVEYVDPPVLQCGSGLPVDIEGDALLFVRLHPAAAHDEQGRATVQNRTIVSDLPLVREARLICDFEGYVEWLEGLRARRPFRVLELTGPARIVVDVRTEG